MRPVLLAMTNPHSDDPERALYPEPVGSSGWRAFKLIWDVHKLTVEEYAAAFDRRNLITGAWSASRAAVAAPRFLSSLAPGSEVVVFGAEVWGALGLGKHPSPGRTIKKGGSSFCFLPHPSGKNLWYNDRLNRWCAGEILAGLMRRGKLCAA